MSTPSPMLCPVDRYSISELAAKIHDYEPELQSSEITRILTANVNSNPDKVESEFKKRGYLPAESIGSSEAYGYITKLILGGKRKESSSAALVARGMEKVFFGGDVFKLPSPVLVKVQKCHDGDTCTIVQYQPKECNAESVTVNVRISGGDTPEVGPYSERLADGTRKKGADYPYALAPAYAAPKEGWINAKLVENLDKVHLRLSKGLWDPKKISYKEREAFNNILALTITFTGEVGTLPLNDLITWNVAKNEEGLVLMHPSAINWTSDDTPPQMCGVWQPRDKYGRGLGLFEERDPKRLSKYIRERLSAVMREEGDALFTEYKQKVAAHLATLSKSKNDKLYAMAQQLVANIKDPVETFDKATCEKIADSFDALVKDNPIAAADRQVFQIITGTMLDYQKYRNQRGDVNEKAGIKARAGKFGFVGEIAFKAWMEGNDEIPRYKPPKCNI